MNNIRKPNKRKTPVTIIVGIICKDKIVLTSDSQTSFGSSKRTDTNKISVVKFADNNPVLVAQSGNAELSSRAIEQFEKLAKTTQFDDYRRPVEAMEEALRLLKQDVIRLNNWESNRELAHEFFQDLDNNFSLMIAYYYGAPPLPYLYTVSFWPGIAARQYGYSTLGCGSTVAEFILSRSKVSEMETSYAIMTAIYTVEEVKKVDAFCGGQTKIAILDINHKAITTNNQKALDLIKCTIESMERYEEQTKIAWKAMMDTIANEAIENFDKKYPEKNEDKKDE